MTAVVRIPTPLRKIAGGLDQVKITSAKVNGMITELESKYPGIKERLVDNTGELHRFVNIYVNGEDVRFISGLDTAIKEGDEVSIVPAVAGGIG